MAPSLKTVRALQKSIVSRNASFIIKAETTIEELETRVAKLDEAWTSYHSVQQELVALEIAAGATDEEIESMISDSELIAFETKYYDTKAKFLTQIKKLRGTNNNVHGEVETNNIQNLADQQAKFLETLSRTCFPTVKAESQLPKINIKVFDGHLCDWASFRDLFVSSVHDNIHLTSSQKFHYLKSFLADEPATLLKHIAVTEENYLEAWNKLNARYNKKGLIASSYVRKLLKLSQLTTSNLNTLRQFVDTVDEVIRGLRALGGKAENRDVWLLVLLYDKLDSQNRSLWLEHIHAWKTDEKDKDFPTIYEFLDFLEIRCASYETSYTTSEKSKKQPIGKQGNLKTYHGTRAPGCPKCSSTHELFNCPQFIAYSTSDRSAFVKSRSLCFNCLRPSHRSASCNSKHRCHQCRQRHHSLLHINNTYSSQSNPTLPRSATVEQSASTIASNHSVQQFKPALLPTAVVKLFDVFGEQQSGRALLDSGSEVSFITERCVNRLGLSRKHAKFAINALGSSKAGSTRGMVELTLHSYQSNKSLYLQAYILEKITASLPSFDISSSKLIEFHKLPLADPQFHIAAPIDILIGSDCFFETLENETHTGHSGQPSAIRTIFGWVIAGDSSGIMSNPCSYHVVKASSLTSSIHQRIDRDFDLKLFWELEEAQLTIPLTQLEQQAEDHFAMTHSRSIDGKYIVELPFCTTNAVDFGNTLQPAVKRLESMERRFKQNATLAEMYSSFMKEYETLGHMSQIPPDKISVPTTNCYYLPHHGVWKHDSSTTKLRVVFDGSSKFGSNPSLNETLLIGPPLQREVFSVCLRFRRHQYALTGDIEKMFRQIWVAPKHRDYQRILWRDSPKQPFKHYQLNTVTYGTSSAPYLSIRVLRQLASDIAEQHPKIAEILLNDFYVDDAMTGGDTVEEVIQLYSELAEVLASAGLILRKWSTNCWPLLSRIPEDRRALLPLNLSEDTTVKVLGLFWYPTKDSFSYHVDLPMKTVVTKRQILSDASKVFDPLGFLAPTIIMMKIIFQSLWLEDIDWDDELSDTISETWSELRSEIKMCSKIEIPRKLWLSHSSTQFHCFSDASEKAFAAVIYCRSIKSNNEIETTLVAAKTRVAPLKQISIPRLELCAASLLCKLVKKVSQSLQIDISNFHAWTDSSIVLHWLSSPPRRWSTFIANRTSEILSTLPRDHWAFVKSGDNPADCASRGLLPSNLLNFNLWWKGPQWLNDSPETWPNSQKIDISEVPEDKIEERKTYARQIASNISTTIHSNVLSNIINKNSSWLKLLRITAYCLRFIDNLKLTKNHRNSGSLLARELTNSEILILKFVQQSEFHSEIPLIASQGLRKSSKLLSLSPFIDKYGLVRVGGRISRATISYAARHPVILPKDHRVTHLITHHLHIKHLHVGVAELFFIIRQQYWVIGCRNLLRKLVHDCVICFKQRQRTAVQLMADLPANRITFTRPFSKVGCDYAGPITLRLAKGRNPKYTKSYIALFVCFTTKALHLELVGDLSTPAFLAALDRFMSRRGKPIEIWSDNGTNFVGAKRMLNELQQLHYSKLHQASICDHLVSDNIQWKNIPPHSPHFGGIWESGIRSVKLHLKRVVGDHILTYEELYTLLTRIEGLLNSRPLCVATDGELDALTPAHFLISQPYTALPEPIEHSSTTLLKNWQLVKALSQGFWKRWHKDYLTSLQHRQKWQQQQPNVKKGDVVLLKEPNIAPAKWILARIEECYPGPDGRVRVVTVRTSTSKLERSISKLAPLPFSERTESFSGPQDGLE